MVNLSIFKFTNIQNNNYANDWIVIYENTKFLPTGKCLPSKIPGILLLVILPEMDWAGRTEVSTMAVRIGL